MASALRVNASLLARIWCATLRIQAELNPHMHRILPPASRVGAMAL